MGGNIQAIIEAGKKDKRPAFLKCLSPNDEFTPLNQSAKDLKSIVGYSRDEYCWEDFASQLKELEDLSGTISRGIKKIMDYRPKNNVKGIQNALNLITKSVTDIQTYHSGEYSYIPKFKFGKNIDGNINAVCEQFELLKANLAKESADKSKIQR